jgi:hypothetical protein
MESVVFAELTGDGKVQPVFEGLQVQAELRETLAITSISQSYRNTTAKNMEVVYTGRIFFCCSYHEDPP